MTAHNCGRVDCGELIEGDARYCPRHTEDVNLLFAMFEIRCRRCGLLAPEGVDVHDCRHPAPQPPSVEL